MLYVAQCRCLKIGDTYSLKTQSNLFLLQDLSKDLVLKILKMLAMF